MGSKTVKKTTGKPAEVPVEELRKVCDASMFTFSSTDEVERSREPSGKRERSKR
ncbi:MAG: hypothetical protein QME41_03345 [Actinomycetota bacterium]|nr:hypothetical protein [Actinomycetota bacterium]